MISGYYSNPHTTSQTGIVGKPSEMGCSGSKDLPRLDFPVDRYQHFMNFLHVKCHLSMHDLTELYNAFRWISPGATEDRITFKQYCKYLYFEKTGRFLHTMALYFSSDQETLTFPEFVLLVTFFSTLDEHSIAEFLFVIVTDHGYVTTALGNEASATSLEHIIHQLFGNAWGNDKKIAKILAHMGKGNSRSQSLTCGQFVEYCLSNRSLLHMPVTHQLAMRGKLVAESFWSSRAPVFPAREAVALRMEMRALAAHEPPPRISLGSHHSAAESI